MRPRIASIPRITSLPPFALAGGALTVGVGGLYLAGLLLTGGEIDVGHDRARGGHRGPQPCGGGAGNWSGTWARSARGNWP